MQTFEFYYDGQSGAVSGGEHVRWLYISAGWQTIPGDGVGGRGGGAPQPCAWCMVYGLTFFY